MGVDMLAAGEGTLQMEGYEGPLSPGDTFERYQIRSEIARGGSAFVYEAYQEFLDRQVAIKVIPCQKEQAREFRRRAKAEAVVLSRLRHPNVVPVYDAGVTDDGSLIYIVMEKLDGCTLREVLQTIGPLSVPEALVIGAQACDAVEAAHRHGAIHRDLKPENLFIEHGNQLRVLDFGVAKFRSAGFATTAKHRWHGTPLYMSPEHLQGRGVTARSDIYALGTLLWESLAGRNPCLNGIDTPTFQEIGWIQIASVPPLLTEVVPAIPDYVARVIQRAIAKAPEHRYGSMHELGVALRDVERRFTLECRERRLAPVLREMVECARARAGSPEPVTPRRDTVREPLVAGREPRDTVRMPLPGADAPVDDAAAPGNVALPVASIEPPARPRLHVASVQPPGESTPLQGGPAPHRATVERTPSPVTAPVDEPEARNARPSQPGLAHRDRQRKRQLSSARLGLLGAGVGLVIAVPIGIIIGLAQRHSAPAGAAAPASATLASSAATSPPISPPRAAESGAARPGPPAAHSAPAAASGAPAPASRTAAPRLSAASSASSPRVFGTAPNHRPASRPPAKTKHLTQPDDTLPSSGLDQPDNSVDQPIF
jgi:serine/threonine-protein kinase